MFSLVLSYERSEELTQIGCSYCYILGKIRDAFETALRLDPANSEALGDLFDFYMDAPGMIGGGIEKAGSLLPQFARYDPVGGVLAQAHIAEKKKQYDNLLKNIQKSLGEPIQGLRALQSSAPGNSQSKTTPVSATAPAGSLEADSR